MKIGDKVEIIWRDHFRYSGEIPDEMLVSSWGKVDKITKIGVALVQNEVHNGHLPVTDRVMDGQFILKESIKETRIMK